MQEANDNNLSPEGVAVDEVYERQRAARAELRAKLRAADLQRPHWLKNANRHLERVLLENVTVYGLNPHVSVETPVLQAPETPQEPPTGVYHPAVEQRSDERAELGGFAI